MLQTLSAPAIERTLRSLLAAELVASGRALTPGEAAGWPQALGFGPAGLGLDSLTLLGCGTATNQFFQLHEAGTEAQLLREASLAGWVRIVRAALAAGTSGITVASSGSTGARQYWPHAAATLESEALFWADRFRGIGRVLQAVPAHHIYGFLFTVLLPKALGVPVLDVRGLAPGALRSRMAQDDLLVGVPTTHAALLRSLPGLPAGLSCVSSGSALPAATDLALREAGAAEVTEIYGSSETAGVALRIRADAPFRLLPRWRPGASGATASVIEARSGAAIPLPDKVGWGADGALHLLGRKDNAVQVGGVNVHPARIAARLAEHPLVADCAVRLDAALAEPRLKAFLVPAAGIAPGEAVAALEGWCREHLSGAERPIRIDAGTALPTAAMGKPGDWPAAAA